MSEILRGNGEKWLICGGRDFGDAAMFSDAMRDLMRHFGHPDVIVHGDATGADTMAGELARRLSISEIACPADWKTHGRAAGPIRNKGMLAHGIDKVIAFPGGKGTANMIKQARAAGVDVVEIKST